MSFSGLMFLRVPVAVVRRRVVMVVEASMAEVEAAEEQGKEVGGGRGAGEGYIEVGSMTSGGIWRRKSGSSGGSSADLALTDAGAAVRCSSAQSAPKRGKSELKAGLENSSAASPISGVLRNSEKGVSLGDDDSKSCSGVPSAAGDVKKSQCGDVSELTHSSKEWSVGSI